MVWLVWLCQAKPAVQGSCDTHSNATYTKLSGPETAWSEVVRGLGSICCGEQPAVPLLHFQGTSLSGLQLLEHFYLLFIQTMQPNHLILKCHY